MEYPQNKTNKKFGVENGGFGRPSPSKCAGVMEFRVKYEKVNSGGQCGVNDTVEPDKEVRAGPTELKASPPFLQVPWFPSRHSPYCRGHMNSFLSI